LEELTQPLSQACQNFLKNRGFGPETISHNNIRTAFKKFNVDGQYKELECIAIPSMKDGECVSIKYRSIDGVHHGAASASWATSALSMPA
jgi:hypothetical protein